MASSTDRAEHHAAVKEKCLQSEPPLSQADSESRFGVEGQKMMS